MSVEKAIAAGIEPLLDDVLELCKRVDAIALLPGPAGEKGESGPPGAQGEKGEPGKDGAPGRDANVIALADVLKNDPEFIKVTRAEPEAVEIDLDALAEVIKADPDLTAALRGETGASGAPGPAGNDGEPGEPGAGIDSPAHIAGRIYREGATVTAHAGQFYRALVDTNAAPGDSDDWQRLTNAGFRWRGTKPDPATLKEGDLYIDGGSAFIVANGAPAMLAQRGKNGAGVADIRYENDFLIIELDNHKALHVDATALREAYQKANRPTFKKLESRLTDLETRLAIAEERLAFLGFNQEGES
jgi:hypothetical protein